MPKEIRGEKEKCGIEADMEGEIGWFFRGSKAAAVDIESFVGGGGKSNDEAEEHCCDEEKSSACAPSSYDNNGTGNDFEPSNEVGGISIVGRKENLVVEDVFGEGCEVAEFQGANYQKKES